jgi:RHS repeat-associated protein
MAWIRRTDARVSKPRRRRGVRRVTVLVAVALMATLLSPGPASGSWNLPSLGGVGGWFGDLFGGGQAEAVPPSYDELVQGNSPSLYWRLHESSGSVVNDGSGFGRNGTFGSGVSKGQPGLISGDTNKAVSKDGTAGPVATASGVSGLPSGAAARTIEVWFSGDDVSGAYRNILTVGDFYISGSYGGVNMGSGSLDLDPVPAPAGGSYRDGRRHLMTATYDGSLAILYVDGVELGRRALSLNTAATQTVTVGGSPNATFDEVAVYPSALSAAQVNANWTAGGATAGACAATASGRYAQAVLADQPAVFYRLGEDPAGSLVTYDSSGNCRNGAYTRFAATAPGLIVGEANSGATAPNPNDPYRKETAWANGSGLPTGAAARTIEVWFSGSDDGITYPNILTVGDFYISGSYGSVNMGSGSLDLDPVPAPAGGSYRDGRRHLMTATYDGSTAILYVDGVELGRRPLPLNTPAGHQLLLGSTPNATYDDVAVYPTALSPARVAAHWTAGASSGAACGGSGGASGYSSAVLGDSPVAYYRLNEDPAASPVAYDSSGNCRNGAYTQWAATAPGLIKGEADPGIKNSAQNEWEVMSANGADLPTGSSERSLEVWVKLVARSGPDYPWMLRLGDFGLSLNWGAARINGGGTHYISPAGTLRNGQPHLLTATYDGTTAKLYVDGVEVAGGPMALNTTVPSSLELGSDWFANMDEAAVYNYALSPSQIAGRAALGLKGPLSPDELNGGCVCAAGSPGVGLVTPTVGNPVVLATGNETEPAQDLKIPGRGIDLSVDRMFNSSESTRDGLFGFGWSSNIGMNLSIDPLSQQATIRQENGSVARFDLVNGAYVPPDHVTSTLTFDAPTSTYRFQRHQQETIWFDGTAGPNLGRLVKLVDMNQYATTVAYPDATHIVMTEPAGRTLTFTLDANRHVTSVADTASPVRAIAYSYVGSELRTVTSLKANTADTTPTTWQYGYDPTTHQITSVTNPRGHQMTTHYNQSRVDYQIDYSGARTDFAYSGTNPLTVTVTAPTNNAAGTRPVTQYTFTNLLMTSRIDGYGTAQAAEWQYEYDSTTFQETKVIDPYLNAAMTSSYDTLRGNQLWVEDALERRTTFTYNLRNLVRTTTDKTGVVTTYEYNDADGVGDDDDGPNLVEVCAPLGALPTPPQTISCNSAGVTKQRTQYGYTDPTKPGDRKTMTDAENKVWNYSYDTYGLLSEEIDPEDNKTTTTYDNVGRIQSTVAPKGNVVGGTPNDYKTTYQTNPFGDVERVTDPLGKFSIRHYDQNRNVDTESDPNNHATGYVFDNLNRVIQVNRADSTTLGNQYWADGSLRAQIDGATAATNYAYDPLGRLSTVIDPNVRTTTYGYDLVGNLKTRQEQGGNCGTDSGCVTYNYNTLQQLTGVAYSDPATTDITAVTYDSVGRRKTQTLSDGRVYKWDWDSLGRLEKTTDPDTTAVGYGWDLNNHLTKLAYPGGSCTATPNVKCVTRTYDDAGRFTAVSDWDGNTTAFDYDENSNNDTVTFPTGTDNVDTFTYDRADRMSGSTFKQGGTTLGSLSYTRSNSGQLKSETKTGLPGGNQTYNYDSVDRLTNVNTWFSYGYDSADNLTTLLNGTRLVSDPANQLCFTAPSGITGGSCTEPPDGSTSYEHDSRGNRTKVTPPTGRPSTMTYDQDNRLKQVNQGAEGEYNPTWSTVTMVDTTTGAGTCDPSPCAAPGGGATMSAKVTGGWSGIPDSARAVMLNVTASGSTAPGYLTVYPSNLASNPGTSNLNFGTGEQVSNSVVAKISADGRVKIFNGSSAGVDIRVEVTGWFAEPSAEGGTTFEPVTPTRLVFTPGGGSICDPNPCAQLNGNSSMAVDVTGAGPVPASGVSAVAVNVTVLLTAAAGNMTVYKNGTTEPAQPNLYWTAGELHAAMVIVPVDVDGRIRLENNSTGATHVIVDVQGYFTTAPDSTPNVLKTLTPARVLDTQTSTGVCTPDCTRLQAATATTVQISGQGGIPTGATAASVTITAINGSTLGWLQAAPDGSFVAGATSVVNYDTGETVANSAILQLPANGKIVVYSPAAVDVTIDVNGYFAAPQSTFNYGYDGDGLRRTKTWQYLPVTYRYSLAEGLAQPIEENFVNLVHTYFIYGPDGLPIEQITEYLGTVTKVWFHHDQLGSTRLLTDENGNWRTKYSYDPYGNPAGTETNSAYPTVTTNQQYAGQYTDTETGYQYLRARYYDPTTGRFLTRDPIEALTRSAYGYVGGSPLNYTDPAGLCFGPMCAVEQALETVGAVVEEAEDMAADVRDSVNDSVARAPGAAGAAIEWVEEHGTVSFTGGCLIWCYPSVTYQNGRWYKSTGGYGLQTFGIGLGFNTALPEEQDPCSFQFGGGWGPANGTFNSGQTLDGGSFLGFNYTLTPFGGFMFGEVESTPGREFL